VFQGVDKVSEGLLYWETERVRAAARKETEVTQEATALDFEPARRVVEEMSPVCRGDLIPLLQRLQAAYGYLPRPVMDLVSRMTRIPTSQMYGVATFYAQFHMEPHGRHTVRCCRGTACHVRGSKKVIEAVQGVLGIEDGETTPDMQFSLETVACLGTCFLAPVIMVDGDYYGHMTPDRLSAVLARYK